MGEGDGGDGVQGGGGGGWAGAAHQCAGRRDVVDAEGAGCGSQEEAKKFGAKGLAYLKLGGEVGAGKMSGPVAKFINEEKQAELRKLAGASDGDVILFTADKLDICHRVLGELRQNIARQLNMIPEGKWNFLWIVKFPSFDYDEGTKRHIAKHHPFTAPLDEDLHLLDSDPTKVHAKAYDIVLNGIELGGGSIRIHQKDIQSKVFGLLGISPEDAQKKFAFLLDAACGLKLAAAWRGLRWGWTGW